MVKTHRQKGGRSSSRVIGLVGVTGLIGWILGIGRVRCIRREIIGVV